jgi:hypothetical protein
VAQELDERSKRWQRAVNQIFDINQPINKPRKNRSFVEAMDIRADYLEGGMTQQEIADKYNCTQGTVSKIVNFLLWPVERR